MDPLFGQPRFFCSAHAARGHGYCWSTILVVTHIQDCAMSLAQMLPVPQGPSTFLVCLMI